VKKEVGINMNKQWKKDDKGSMEEVLNHQTIQYGLSEEELYPKVKSASVLCRGTSLGDINKMPICDTTILVNSFQNELKIKDVSNYVKKHNSVIHITSAQCESYGMYEKDLYSRYNFTKIVLPYVKECSPKIYFFRDGDPKRCVGFNRLYVQGHGVGVPIKESWIYKIRDFNAIDKIKTDKEYGHYVDMFLPVENMSDKNKEDMVKTKRYKYSSPTSGMDSILYAVNDLNAKEIFIIGLDFYDGVGYLTNSFGQRPADTKTAIDRGEDPDEMKSFFYNFVKKHNDVKFTIFTKAKLKTNIKNLEIHTIPKEGRLENK